MIDNIELRVLRNTLERLTGAFFAFAESAVREPGTSIARSQAAQYDALIRAAQAAQSVLDTYKHTVLSPEDAAKLETSTIGETINYGHLGKVLEAQKQSD